MDTRAVLETWLVSPYCVWAPLFIEASRSYSDTPHSVRLLRTSDQPDTETSTWHHTKHTRDRHPCPRWDSNPTP